MKKTTNWDHENILYSVSRYIVGLLCQLCFIFQDLYGDHALFFHDKYGGHVIGVLFKPQFFQSQDFSVRIRKQ